MQNLSNILNKKIKINDEVFKVESADDETLLLRRIKPQVEKTHIQDFGINDLKDIKLSKEKIDDAYQMFKDSIKNFSSLNIATIMPSGELKKLNIQIVGKDFNDDKLIIIKNTEDQETFRVNNMLLIRSYYLYKLWREPEDYTNTEHDRRIHDLEKLFQEFFPGYKI